MMGKDTYKGNVSSQIKLEDLLDKQHGLYQMANRLNWDYLVDAYGPYYVENNGRPGIPIRVIVGLHYLKPQFGVFANNFKAEIFKGSIT